MEPDNSDAKAIPYWLVNVPRDKWPAECPEYLRNLSDKDVEQLGVLDEDYQSLTWDEVRQIVESNRLGDLYRVPSELRRYRWYTAKIERNYGSVMKYMLQERLHWTSLQPRSAQPFECKDDYKILRNDWPYGVEPSIIHLVVWTKTLFPAEPSTGTLTPASSAVIDTFVQHTFGQAVGKDRLLWFKNPIALRSVAAVEHFHVMLYDPPKHFVHDVTDGDPPTSERVGVGLDGEYL